MNREPPDAILMVSDSLTTLNRQRVFDFAAERCFPPISSRLPRPRRRLTSYGPDLTASFERAGDLDSRIFQSARPADLPFEQPTRYPFIVNLKIAKSAGLDMPPMLVALADEVIE